MGRWLWLACALLLSLSATRAAAHPLMPVAISLLESGDDTFRLRLRHPTRLQNLDLRLPDGCTLSHVTTSLDEDQTFELGTLRCRGQLTGQTLALSGLSPELPTAILHIQYRNGEGARAVLSVDQPSVQIPRPSSLGEVLLQFGKLGGRHLFAGLDHLLFTAGLMLLGFGRRVVWLLTAFTVGHSLTLALLVLGGLALPRAPVEIGIAASLIALALSVLSQRTGAGAARELRGAALLTLAVGLLHGLGFADGLQQLALPTQALWPALLGFNLGVEAAQLGLVLTVAPLLALLSRVTPARQQALRGAAGYLIGSLAAMWLIERTLELFS